MADLLPGPALLLAFFAASLVLAVTPGPGVVYVVARTLTQGRGAGLASVAGVALGNLGNALGASIGLAALFAWSTLAFTLVRYAGAAYLLYLAWQALRAPERTHGLPQVPAAPVARILRDGFFVALLNPKTAIFFAAFLPQFIDPAVGPVLQSIALSAMFVLLAACTDSAWVLLAVSVAPLLGRGSDAARASRYAPAVVYLALGIYALLSDQRAARPSAGA